MLIAFSPVRDAALCCHLRSRRVIREVKRGTIFALILASKHTQIRCLLNNFSKNYHGAIGSLEDLVLFSKHICKQWISERFFSLILTSKIDLDCYKSQRI